jgi:hypothetical protein
MVYAAPIRSSVVVRLRKRWFEEFKQSSKHGLKLPPCYSTNEVHSITNVETLEEMSILIINNFYQKLLLSSKVTISSSFG